MPYIALQAVIVTIAELVMSQKMAAFVLASGGPFTVYLLLILPNGTCIQTRKNFGVPSVCLTLAIKK